MRRCVVCRRSSPVEQLFRCVLQDGGRLMWDGDRHAVGRGAYVHRSLACVSRLANVGPWAHALRVGQESIDRLALRALAEQLQGQVV
ncbi:MAG: YlxR family protein [Oligoflexia bacterium]|nr:YlxR family protein [Oligoflexia bacterium]